jgi:hypothetical protein
VKIAVFAVLLQYLILHKIGLKCGYCGFNHGNIVVVRSYKKKNDVVAYIALVDLY